MSPLREALDAARFGGKAAALARALVEGFAVPDGFALEAARAGTDVRADVEAALGENAAARWAVRSSAVGEDSEGASFAGQHVTRLAVRGVDAVVAAIAEVQASASSAAALAYRRQRGVAGPVQCGVVVQRLVDAEVAGVAFSRHPVTGADEVLIEVSWGLGEGVVAGLVTPDRYRLDPTGVLLERTLGEKEVCISPGANGVDEVETDEARRAQWCLTERECAAVFALVRSLDRVWAPPHDIELAFSGGTLYLLQRRPLTRRGT